MSIIPIETNLDVTVPDSSDRDPVANPDHGSAQPPCRRGALQHGGTTAATAPVDLAVGIDDSAGVIPDSLDRPCGSSPEEAHAVHELKASDSRKCSNGQKVGAHAQNQSTGRGDASFRGKSVQDRFTRYGGIASDSTSPTNFQQFIAVPRGSHGNMVHMGTKKSQLVNANHLLNFHYDPIQRSQPRISPLKKQQKVRPFKRDLFLQANYRFVLLDTGRYVVESIDPDKMLQWEDVVCVQFSTPSIVQCPICLEIPLCPQITSCGHIYCFPCILQYLLLGEEDHKGECWKKCPLCFMMISLKDLYTIYIDHVKQFNVGDHAYFTLMTRRKDSFVPIQVNETASDLASPKNNQISSFSKFILTSDVEMSVREAKSNLNEWLAKAKSGVVDDLEKLPYVCVALEQLEQRSKGWAEHQASSNTTIGSPVKKTVSEPVTKSLPCSNFKDNSANTAIIEAWESASEGNESHVSNVLNANQLNSQSSLLSDLAPHSEYLGNGSQMDIKGTGKRLSHGSSDAGHNNAYVFYQAIDGQRLILHPLNMKCLLYHYKSSDLLPPRISGRILELESVTQSEASRRRYRFLSHFSLTTSFQLCEIDLRDMLPAYAFSPFLDEIKKREKQRKLIARKERRFKSRSKATVSCDRTIPSHSEAHVNDVAFTLDEFEALGNCTAPSNSPPVTGDKKLFADVTRLGFAAVHDSPSLSVEGPSTSSLLFANVLTTEKKVACQDTPQASTSEKKGKKATRVLLSTAGGRRY